MKAEETLQYMADFYRNLFPTRKHALNQLFCVIGNGYEWENGELVEHGDPMMNRYKLVKKIKKAVFPCEEEWLERSRAMQQLADEAGKTTPAISRYTFSWYPLSRKYSKLFNYPEDIKPDWKALLDECRSMLIADGINLDDVGN